MPDVDIEYRVEYRVNTTLSTANWLGRGRGEGGGRGGGAEGSEMCRAGNERESGGGGAGQRRTGQDGEKVDTSTECSTLLCSGVLCIPPGQGDTTKNRRTDGG